MKDDLLGREILIKDKFPKGKKYGIIIGSVHTIVKPPEKHLNSGMSVFIKAGGKVHCVAFPYFELRPKPEQLTEEIVTKKRRRRRRK